MKQSLLRKKRMNERRRKIRGVNKVEVGCVVSSTHMVFGNGSVWA
jgi:hypothetical protein